MRPKPHHSCVQARMGIIKSFVEKSLSFFRMGPIWVENLFFSLSSVVFGNTYIETLASSKADTLHKEICLCDQKLLKRNFELSARQTIKKLNLKHVKVAIDITEDLFWGEGSEYTRASAHEHQLQSWQWVTLAVVDPCYVPLMSLPYRQTDNLDEIVFDLLRYLETLPLKIDLVLFDRGFYHWHIIDYLNGSRRGWGWPYLLLVPENKAMPKYAEQTEDFAYFVHEGDYGKEKSTWKPKTTILVKRVNEKTCWFFATNQKPSIALIAQYRKRWNIETGFRVHDEARIKTKSTKPIIRYFYHLLSFIYLLSWICKKRHSEIPFKLFLWQEQFRDIIYDVKAPT